MEQKKVVYIAGPVTGVKNYWEAFEEAEDALSALGYIPLSPSRLPKGMTNAQYMRICFAMIDIADAVLFLEGWENSQGAALECMHCEYTEKPIVRLRTRDRLDGGRIPQEVTQAWLKADLEEVMKA